MDAVDWTELPRDCLTHVAYWITGTGGCLFAHEGRPLSTLTDGLTARQRARYVRIKFWFLFEGLAHVCHAWRDGLDWATIGRGIGTLLRKKAPLASLHLIHDPALLLGHVRRMLLDAPAERAPFQLCQSFRLDNVAVAEQFPYMRILEQVYVAPFDEDAAWRHWSDTTLLVSPGSEPFPLTTWLRPFLPTVTLNKVRATLAPLPVALRNRFRSYPYDVLAEVWHQHFLPGLRAMGCDLDAGWQLCQVRRRHGYVEVMELQFLRDLERWQVAEAMWAEDERQWHAAVDAARRGVKRRRRSESSTAPPAKRRKGSSV